MRSSSKSNLVFVYGTLRQGGKYHHLLANAVYESTTQTPARYTLVDVGSYPAMLNQGEQAVVGEVYAMDDATLKALDVLEGTPHLYVREQIELQNGTLAWVYFLLPHLAKGLPSITSGDYFSSASYKESL